MLVYRGQKLAVIEAKRRDLPDTEGVAQAKRYAEKLQTRFTYATNGVGIYQIDMETGTKGYIDKFPGPDELWTLTYAEENEWHNRFAAVPFEDKGGTWEARYSLHNAIDNTLEALAAGQERILLTLATGTGKTFIAFQLVWKLFQTMTSAKPTNISMIRNGTANHWNRKPVKDAVTNPVPALRDLTSVKSAAKAPVSVLVRFAGRSPVFAHRHLARNAANLLAYAIKKPK